MGKDDPRPRVVFDCMVYLQALVSESGPAAALLRLVDDDALSLFVSNEIIDEVLAVLSRPKLRKRNPKITAEGVYAFIKRISESATLIEDVPRHFTYSRDPKDEKYINLAVEGGTNYLISRDRDLLDLTTGYTDECKDFRRRFKSLKIVTPEEFLERVALEESR